MMINILKAAIEPLMTYHEGKTIGYLLTVEVVAVFIWTISGLGEEEVGEDRDDDKFKPFEN